MQEKNACMSLPKELWMKQCWEIPARQCQRKMENSTWILQQMIFALKFYSLRLRVELLCPLRNITFEILLNKWLKQLHNLLYRQRFISLFTWHTFTCIQFSVMAPCPFFPFWFCTSTSHLSGSGPFSYFSDNKLSDIAVEDVAATQSECRMAGISSKWLSARGEQLL